MTAVMEKTNLVVPMGFVEIDSEEMTYVEGGVISVSGSITLTANLARSMISFAVAAIVAQITAPIIAGLKKTVVGATLIPKVAWLAGLIAAVIQDWLVDRFTGGLGNVRIPFTVGAHIPFGINFNIGNVATIGW